MTEISVISKDLLWFTILKAVSNSSLIFNDKNEAIIYKMTDGTLLRIWDICQFQRIPGIKTKFIQSVLVNTQTDQIAIVIGRDKQTKSNLEVFTEFGKNSTLSNL